MNLTGGGVWSRHLGSEYLQQTNFKPTRMIKTSAVALLLLAIQTQSVIAQKFRPSDFPKIESGLVLQLLGSRCGAQNTWKIAADRETVLFDNPLDKIYEPGILYPYLLTYAEHPKSDGWYKIGIGEYRVGKVRIGLLFKGTFALIILDAAKPSVLLMEYGGSSITFHCRTECILNF